MIWDEVDEMRGEWIGVRGDMSALLTPQLAVLKLGLRAPDLLPVLGQAIFALPFDPVHLSLFALPFINIVFFCLRISEDFDRQDSLVLALRWCCSSIFRDMNPAVFLATGKDKLFSISRPHASTRRRESIYLLIQP